MPGGRCADGLARAIVLGKQFDGAGTTFDTRREGRIVFASDHDGIAAGELVLVDVPTARHAMDVVVVRVTATDVHRGLRFTLFLRESLFSFHRSLRHRAGRNGYDS